MAVIFAVVGGGAVVGIATSDPYSDHAYYDWDDYSNYSNAAEKRRRRIEAKNKEIEDKKYEINTYKTQKVNEHLKSDALIQQEGTVVSVPEVEKDGDAKIQSEEDREIAMKNKPVESEIQEIDRVISKIDSILAEDD